MISEFSVDIKTRFLVLHLDAKMKSTRISDLLGTPLRTIQDWIRKTEDGKDIRDIDEGRGPKPKISSKIKTKILRKAREHSERSSTRKVAAEFDLGKTTIHEIYRQKGLKYQKLEKKKNLTPEQEEDRIEFCEEMIEEDGEKIYETFFSDEMGIKLSDTQMSKAWHTPRKKVKTNKPPKDVKVNCWGAISSKGSTSLHIYKENLNAPLYQTILAEHKIEMEQLYPEGFYFQQDNHPSHQASESWIDENGLKRILFPDYSPDLNIIENLWSALKYAVACDAPKTEKQLIKSLQDNWEKLTTPENLRAYFESLHTRLYECIEENGKRLCY